MLPEVWFIFSRKGCDVEVQYLEEYKLLDKCEMSEVDLALKRFRIKYPDAVRESAVKRILRGVAAHHAVCLPLWKSFIEELFQRRLVKVVFATETLAAGFNMPARMAVISPLSKESESGRVNLSPNELLQMAGRAGRRALLIFVSTSSSLQWISTPMLASVPEFCFEEKGREAEGK
ncbi:DExH-box ATP-dependent RNA helicase DExH15 chloroplastic-like [Rutidosis leptorrhynchoides]|uniref:DExH-box ATP-dependent RNA helicase DExH15 chloroplastic-like n=1 Tax=Rutidosis leptorrhynchoides TaxID=125765 RepID=UPI003A99CBB4